MTDANLIRLGILVAGALLILAIFWFGRPPKKTQGSRIDRSAEPSASLPSDSFGENSGHRTAEDARGTFATEQSAVNSQSGDAVADTLIANAESEIGKRQTDRLDQVVKLFVAARTGTQFDGSDIVVAAEKIGLQYGFGSAYHRLVDRKPHLGPIYTVANVQHRGSLDVAANPNLQTPAIVFYLVLPAPIPALDAIEMMLPAAQRAAELLGGILLDDQQNAMSRQSHQHLREQMRQYDREHEIDASGSADKGPRWP